MKNDVPLSGLGVTEYCRVLASDSPAPGGGSTAALCAALAAALGAMAGNITAHHADAAQLLRLTALNERADELQKELLSAVDADAAAYAAFTAVLKRDKNDPERPRLREEKLRESALVPLRIMELGADTARLLEDYAAESSPTLLSDVATGAALLEGALRAGAVNVRVNTAGMKDRESALALEQRAEELLVGELPRLRELFERLYREL